MLVTFVPLPPPAGVVLYAHVGAIGGGGDAGGGGDEGGAEGGAHSPSHSTMYSAYTRLPSKAPELTPGDPVVTKLYTPSVVMGSGAFSAHMKKPRPSNGDVTYPSASTSLAL